MVKITKKVIGLMFLCTLSVLSYEKTAQAETEIPLGGTWTNGYWTDGDSDNMHQYQFAIPSDGKVTVTCQSSVTTNWSWGIVLKNEDCTEEYNSEYSSSGVSLSEYLKAGTYGIQFDGRYNDAVNYKIKLEFQAVSCNVPEPNNDFVSATPISLNQLQMGLLTDANPEDYFKIQINSATTLKIITTGERSRSVVLYDKDFVKVESDHSNGNGAREMEKYVSPGIYYINISRHVDTPYTLKCIAQQYVTGIQLKSSLLTITKGTSVNLLSAVTPSNATQKTLKWTTSDSSVATVSSAGRVTAKAAGYANITATTTDGSNISKKATVIVRPAKASLKKVTLSKYNKRQISITAKSQKNASYQYQYAKNKQFKKAKSIRSSYASLTTSTLSKKKKYYVRVRACYTYYGKNYYGEWSKAKSIRTKK